MTTPFLNPDFLNQQAFWLTKSSMFHYVSADGSASATLSLKGLNGTSSRAIGHFHYSVARNIAARMSVDIDEPSKMEAGVKLYQELLKYPALKSNGMAAECFRQNLKRAHEDPEDLMKQHNEFLAKVSQIAMTAFSKLMHFGYKDGQKSVSKVKKANHSYSISAFGITRKAVNLSTDEIEDITIMLYASPFERDTWEIRTERAHRIYMKPDGINDAFEFQKQWSRILKDVESELGITFKQVRDTTYLQ